MKTYTVKELHEILSNAIDNGKGDLVILVPNSDEDLSADYATLGKINFDDAYAECVYFDQNCGEEEDDYWIKREEE